MVKQSRFCHGKYAVQRRTGLDHCFTSTEGSNKFLKLFLCCILIKNNSIGIPSMSLTTSALKEQLIIGYRI